MLHIPRGTEHAMYHVWRASQHVTYPLGPYDVQNMYDMHSTRLEMPGERKKIGQRGGKRIAAILLYMWTKVEIL
jgi:hypothetical protein